MYHFIVENQKGYLFHKGQLVSVSPVPYQPVPYDAVMYDGYTFAVNVDGVDVLYFLPLGADPITGSYTLDVAGRIVGTNYLLSTVKHGHVKPDAILSPVSVNN